MTPEHLPPILHPEVLSPSQELSTTETGSGSLAVTYSVEQPRDPEATDIDSLPEHITATPGESSASFLLRGCVELGGFTGKVTLRKALDTITPHADALIAATARIPETSIEERSTRSAQSIALLEADSLRLAAPVKAGSVGAAVYDLTQRSRKLFTIGTGAAAQETYASLLFAPSGSSNIHTHIAESLAGKRIVNLGGGNSRLQEDLHQHNVAASVKNVEPYPSPNAEKYPDGYDKLIKANPATADFIETSGLEPGEADEILAAFSVPAYLGTSKEVTQLFKNIETLLAPGGTARIAPLGVVGASENDPRVASIIESARDLANQDYLVEAVYTPRGITLLLTAPTTS